MWRSWRTLLLALLTAYPALVGYGGANPFHVAPFRASGENFAPGEWVESTTVSSKDAITIVLMASWCPHCARMIDQLAADEDARAKVDMVVFFDDEAGSAARQGSHLTHPQKLYGRRLPYYFAKKREFAGLYSGFPTVLSCTREGCTKKGRATLGLR
jgi:thiol-disulfide isomerase/thioredoxin